jgi:predicted negative regulator of RcsB-dependent stress response
MESKIMLRIGFVSLLLCSLITINALSLEEKYNKAVSLSEEKEIIEALEEIVDEDINSYYGQMSLLELGKISILKRDYEEAIDKLKEIHREEVGEKEYWMANAYLKNGQYDSAIISSQNFIFDSNDKSLIESAYFVIAESYISQKSYSRALNTLEFLRNSEFIENNIPLLHYKVGYCQEMLGNYDSSLNSYKKLKMEFPYHQYSYLAEDRIYQLTKMRIPEITDEDLQDFRTTDSSNENADQNESVTYQVTKKYLQVGAFSRKENAQNLAGEIRKYLKDDYIIFSKTIKDKTLHILAYGPFDRDSDLNEVKKKLDEKGYSSFTIRR